jgi:tetratricopeptide (TPR) repeat protein
VGPFDSVELPEAVRLLAAESGHADSNLADIATLLGCEPPVLRWAAGLARAMGWGPLRRRILERSLPGPPFPWSEAVARAARNLLPADAELLGTLAACDAPFGWDVLESVASAATVDRICRLEEAGLLARKAGAGAVTFAVPFAVRACQANAAGVDADSGRWLRAWVQRARELRSATYGPNAEPTLFELAAAIPLATRALSAREPGIRTLGLELWSGAADALFFGRAVPFDAPAFAQAVAVADSDAPGDIEGRLRARVVAGRARLELGDPKAAVALAIEALGLAPRPDLRAEALRAAGWAALALTDFAASRSAFEEACRLCADDPRGQADATAGLGMLALLGGDAGAARALLEEAVAIHVVMRDAPREAAAREMMALVPDSRPGDDDRASLASQVDEFRAGGQRWREALALARISIQARARGEPDVARLRLVEARAAAVMSRMPASVVARALVEAQEPTPEGAPAPRPIVVGPEGRTLTLPSGETHDLSRHGPVRRVLWALALARTEQPGVAASTLDVIEAGWPGEKMQHGAATLRVYTTIRRLRSLGLAGALLTHDEGYLLDPDVSLMLDR